MNKLIIRRLLFLFAGVLISSAVLGQEITVTGTVTDQADGSPLPGVNVIVKGTFTGTNTNAEGFFSITVERGAILEFSYIGYIPKDLAATEGAPMQVTLQMDLYNIEEVVSIGYGTVRKSDATGSVSAVSANDFNVAITSPQELISGKIAGVQITTGGGAPGEGATIRIRGGSSLSATNDPLIVIDGVPVDNGGISGMRNGLNTIHPSDIETFTVLKDASATAIYGSRASNGVIIITTKKGAAGKPLSVAYNGNVTISTPSDYVDVLSATEFRTLVNSYYADNANATDLIGDAETDWQKEIYQTAVSHDHNLSLSGTAYNLPYRVSLGYSNQNGILKTDNLERFTGALTLTPSFLEGYLDIALNAKGMVLNNFFANRGAVGSAVSFDPTQPVLVEGGDYGGYYTWLQTNGSGLPITIATSNPLAQLNMREDESTVYRLIGNVQFDYKMHFMPELKATLNLGIDRSSSTGTIFVDEEASWAITDGGEKGEYTQLKSNELLDFYLNYSKEIPGISSRLNATAGYSWQHFYNKGTNLRTNVAETVTFSDTDYKNELYLLSFFGRLNYTFKERYLFTATMRYDGSSRFSPETRWGLFPALAFAWDMAQEPFMTLDVINSLKLRVGWGVTGQQDIGGYYVYLPRYTQGLENAQYMFGDTYYLTLRPEGYDYNIKWEETTTYNAGFDFGILSNRINGSFDIYYRETNDLLNYIPVPAGTNLTNYINTNVGDLVNRGVEFSVTGKVISTPDMVWSVGFNATMNRNEITKLTMTDDPTYIGVFTGGISGGVGNNIQVHSVGYPANSFYVYEQVYDEEGFPIEGLYVDRNEDGEITEADKYHFKSPAPDVFLGITSGFEYKGFDASFSGRASIGNYIYDNMESTRGTYNNLYNSVGYLNNVTPSIYEAGFENSRYWSDYYMHNGSYFRMDNISLGYTFGEIIPQVSSLRVYGTIQNAFIITKYKGLDPEVFSGIDDNIYPRPRNFIFGVSVQF
jgi:iron complex outermembrane receptor protein